MSRNLSPLLLSAFVLSAACAGENPTAPAADLSVLASSSASGPITRPAGGRCATTVKIVAPFPDFTTPVPQPILNLEIKGVCNLRHLGRTTTFAIQTVNLFTGLIANSGTSTAANGDVVVSTFNGYTIFNNGIDAIFAGTETYVSGTGRFQGVSGSTELSGTAKLNPIAGTGIGEYTSKGTITY